MTDYTRELENGRPIDLRQAVADYEGELATIALDCSDGSVRAAAKLLSVPESTLRYRLRQLQIDSTGRSAGSGGDPDTPPAGPGVVA